MTFEQLNKRVAAYQANPSQETFADLYTEAKTSLLSLHINAVLATRVLSEHDAYETFNDAIMYVADLKGDHNHGAMLSGRLKLLRLDLLRKTKRRTERFVLAIDSADNKEDDSHAPTYEVIDDKLTDISVLETKDAQKRQLLDILADRANDPVATAIATYKFTQPTITTHLTDNALAKELNMCHKTFARKLRVLAQQYKPDKDGDIRDFFPVGLRVKQQHIPA
ncbi:hypothetical protein [Paenibacillus xylanexedens]|uniref:hypothetical protein n=1 Tax=Paenibacillus xylanexedens TaxID=528191 RepID=UPI00119E7B54|nr:hypothetical protein [Paenibacillus xylanexedens]